MNTVHHKIQKKKVFLNNQQIEMVDIDEVQYTDNSSNVHQIDRSAFMVQTYGSSITKKIGPSNLNDS